MSSAVFRSIACHAVALCLSHADALRCCHYAIAAAYSPPYAIALMLPLMPLYFSAATIAPAHFAAAAVDDICAALRLMLSAVPRRRTGTRTPVPAATPPRRLLLMLAIAMAPCH